MYEVTFYFGINGLARTCLCCGKVIGYTPLGNSVEEDVSKSKQIAEAIVCKECIDKLDSETCFIACDMDKDNYITATYDTLWIRNKGLKEFLKSLILYNLLILYLKNIFIVCLEM